LASGFIEDQRGGPSPAFQDVINIVTFTPCYPTVVNFLLATAAISCHVGLGFFQSCNVCTQNDRSFSTISAVPS
jgi:hypothetical protein